MSTRPVEVYPALAAKAVLDAYARFLTTRATAAAGAEGARSDVPVEQEHEEVPQSLEAALAPLEILFGKTALSAIGIALHGAEPVVRYVEEAPAADVVARAEEDVGDEEEVTSDDDEGSRDVKHHTAASQSPRVGGTAEEESGKEAVTDSSTSGALFTQAAQQRSRCLYHVGEHTLFSPFYCPCSAYAYQSIQRQEAWCCKHLLALQLALRVEATGLPQDTLRVRVVDAGAFEQLLSNAL